MANLVHDVVLENMIARRESAMEPSRRETRKALRERSMESLRAAAPRKRRQPHMRRDPSGTAGGGDAAAPGWRRALAFHPLHVLISRLVLPVVVNQYWRSRAKARSLGV